MGDPPHILDRLQTPVGEFHQHHQQEADTSSDQGTEDAEDRDFEPALVHLNCFHVRRRNDSHHAGRVRSKVLRLVFLADQLDASIFPRAQLGPKDIHIDVRWVARTEAEGGGKRY